MFLPIFVLNFIVCPGTNFVVSDFYIFLKLFSLFFKIIWFHRELPLSSFLLSAFFLAPVPISSLCWSFFSTTISVLPPLPTLYPSITFEGRSQLGSGSVQGRRGPLKTVGKVAHTGWGWPAAIASLCTGSTVRAPLHSHGAVTLPWRWKTRLLKAS